MSMTENLEAIIRKATQDAQISIERLMRQQAQAEGVDLVLEAPKPRELPDYTPEQAAQLQKLLADYNAARGRAVKKFVGVLDELRVMQDSWRAAQRVSYGTKHGNAPIGFPINGPRVFVDRLPGVLMRFWNTLIGVTHDFDVARALED